MIALEEKQNYRFETVEVDLARGCLRRGDKELHLRKKSFQVLVCLLDRRERLVSKEELIKAVWKGTAVTDDAIVQSIKEIRRALGDSSQNPRFIKTVPKVGYRFISPVEEINNSADFTQTEEITRVEIEYEEEDDETIRQRDDEISFAPRLIVPPSQRHTVSSSHRLYIAAILFLTAILASAFYFGASSSESSTAAVVLPQAPGKQTIAVMYFENQSGAAEFDWLREGLADMLITNLSRSGKLTILSRGQLRLLFERTNRNPLNKINLDAALEIARKAQAESVITGSFACIGQTVRIDAQLHKVSDGSLMAAESLTVEDSERILTQIDLLSLKLANRLGITNEHPNGRLLAEAMTDNLEAYRYYSLALEKSYALHSKEAIELLEKAVALDPNFAMARARIGYTYAVSWGLAEKGKPHLERAFALSERLTEKDRLNIAAWYALANLDYADAIRRFREIVEKFPTETESYVRLGRLLRGEGQPEEAANVLMQGLSIDPEDKNLYNILGATYSLMNRHSEAVAMGERYVALAPHEANAYDSLGLFQQHSGNYAAAIENYNRALELKPNFEIALIHLGNAYFQTGRYAAAAEAYKKYIQIAPSENERARGYACLTEIHLRKNNMAEAEKTAAAAFENNKDFFWHLIVIALKHGDASEAAKYELMLSAEKKSSERGARPNRRFDFYTRGYIAFERGRFDEAIMNFKESLRHLTLPWNIEDFEDSLANAYLEIKRYDEAVAEYERILKINPNYPLAAFRLARTYEQKGQPEEARANYLRFLQTWKDADADIAEVIAARKFLGIS
jgi:tetratricopeptide (TPR) repeat protein/DNA-binding winged helix-turn-helix (wHTH) protein